MPEYRFETHEPRQPVRRDRQRQRQRPLHRHHETTVAVEGKHADDVVVEQHGDSITVTGPGRGRLLRRRRAPTSTSSYPTSSDPAVQAPARPTSQVEGTAGHAQRAQRLRRRPARDRRRATCSSRPAPATSASTTCAATSSQERLRRLGVGQVGGPRISTGSGDVTVGTARGKPVVKTGSGDLGRRGRTATSSFSTGSGDLSSTRRTAAGSPSRAPPATSAIGVPAASRCGPTSPPSPARIRSDLEGAGQPAEGQDYIEVRAKTVSGDIALKQV